MNSLYNQALKQSNALRKDLDAFQGQISSSTSSSATAAAPPTISSSATALQGRSTNTDLKLITGQISVGLTSFSRTIDDYDSMAKHEIIAAKQEKAFQYTRHR
jgi:golgi SNAP receptor complex member 2